jgi:flagellin
MISSNLSSHSFLSNLAQNQKELQNSLRQLSTGKRISSAADDPAGLSISSSMESDLRSLKAAHRNAEDGLSMLDSSQGAFNEQYSLLVRMRELTVQGLNDTYNLDDVNNIRTELVELRDEFFRIANTTQFNGNVLSYSPGLKAQFQIGSNNSSDDQLRLLTTDFATSDSSISPLLNEGFFTLNSTTTATSITDANTGLGSSAGAAVRLTKTTLISFKEMLGDTLLKTLDAAMNGMQTRLARVGANHNRLLSIIENNLRQQEGLASASSRITDLDFAEESSKLARLQLRTQASVSALGQAKDLPQSIIQLLQ